MDTFILHSRELDYWNKFASVNLQVYYKSITQLENLIELLFSLLWNQVPTSDNLQDYNMSITQLENLIELLFCLLWNKVPTSIQHGIVDKILSNKRELHKVWAW